MMPKEQSTDFMNCLKKDTNKYLRFEDVFYKAEQDGYIGKIQATLNEIFTEEMKFVLNG